MSLSTGTYFRLFRWYFPAEPVRVGRIDPTLLALLSLKWRSMRDKNSESHYEKLAKEEALLMNKIQTTPVNALKVFLLLLLATSLFLSASVSTAHAQEDGSESIMFSSNEANPGAYSNSGSDPADHTGSDDGSWGTASGSEGSSASNPESLGISILPETGGPLSLLLGLGTLALGATGLLVFRPTLSRSGTN